MIYEGAKLRVCQKTIYRYIYSKEGMDQELWWHLPEPRWSWKIEPVFNVDRITKETIQNGQKKDHSPEFKASAISAPNALCGTLMAHRPSTTRLEQVARLENQLWFRQPRLNIKSLGKYRVRQLTLEDGTRIFRYELDC
ncbi:MAG: hypothetical protein AAGF94_09010 [Pseudomonadota bacterium]